MKNIKYSVKKEITPVEKAASAQQVPRLGVSINVKKQSRPVRDPFESWGDLDPEQFGGTDFPPLATQEELEVLNKFVKANPVIDVPPQGSIYYHGEGKATGFDPEAAWIQTHSGRRFNPTNPNPEAIVIQDVAHALSNMCRFTGHTKKFYSVAQHSVLVSYICDSQDALWGLLHDASEAYCQDMPRPLKKSGKIEGYIEMEKVMQAAICKRFELPLQEPWSVKKADTQLLSTEARDLMSPLHSDWQEAEPALPFLIETWEPQRAKDMFMKRFFELTGCPGYYEHYLQHKEQF